MDKLTCDWCGEGEFEDNHRRYEVYMYVDGNFHDVCHESSHTGALASRLEGEAVTKRITIKVRINGTDENPYHRMGLKQNPFPQIGKAEYDAAERSINSLDGDPIKTEDDLRARLTGFSQEFVDLCVAQWKPGERVEFEVSFPDRY